MLEDWRALEFPEKAALVGALLGSLVPLTVLYPAIWGDWTVWLWPSVMLLVIFGVPAPVANMHLVYAVSVGINIILYALLFWFATILFDTVKRL